eukprot:624181-Prymnesium_polylepis.1
MSNLGSAIASSARACSFSSCAHSLSARAEARALSTLFTTRRAQLGAYQGVYMRTACWCRVFMRRAA